MNDTKEVTLGKLAVTIGIVRNIPYDVVAAAISMHKSGDWGSALGEEDKRLNDDALENGERILSAYTIPCSPDGKIWIITEADRSVTTVLLPSEY